MRAFVRPRAFLLVLLGLIWVIAVCDAEAQRLPLRTYSTADGLAGDHITAILPDSRGFLWIGTYTGLSRFDGREFRTFGADEGLPHPWVHALLEDRDGVIWVATQAGLVRIEPRAQLMTPVTLGGEATRNVMRLLQTRDGRVWAAVQGGLYVFANERAPLQASAVQVPFVMKPPASVSQVIEIEALAEGRDGDLWIGTTWGLVRRLRNGRMIPIAVRPTAEDDRVRHLTVDDAGRLWITHWGIAHRPGIHFGIYVLMPEPPANDSAPPAAPLHARAQHLADSPPQPADVIPLPQRPGDAIYLTAGEVLGNGRVHSVLPLPDGTVWLTTEEGLLRIAQGHVTHYAQRHGLGTAIRLVVSDARGDLWLGTRGAGVMRLERNGFLTYSVDDGVPIGETNAIVEDREGALCLMGTDGGRGEFWVGVFDRARNQLVRFVPKGTERLKYWGWGWNQLFLQDRQGEWWLPTGSGLFRYPAAASCTSMATHDPIAVYTQRDGLPSDEIFRLFEDSRGDLWMSVGPSAVRWVRKTGKFEVVTDRRNPPTVFTEDRAGHVWIGFYESGLARWGDGKLQWFGAREGVPEGLVSTLYNDANGHLWLGSDPNGLAQIEDPTADVLHIVRPPPDRGINNLVVNSIVEDRLHRLYVGTMRGMLRFDPRQDPTLARARWLQTSDGLASNEIKTAFADRRGTLWFGTHRALSRLDPRPDEGSEAPTIFIDSLRVGGIPQRLSQLGAPLVEDIRVDPESRRLEIGYGSPSLAPGDTRRYQVRLHGIDPDWGPPTSNRSALYLNLAPGDYRFEARALDTNGRASTQPAVVLFTILPPIWQRAWFRVLALVVIAGAGYLAYHSRVRHLLAIERMRSRIATDLHDDLGARLSRISILSEVAARRVASDAPSAERLLDEVGETARSLIEATADITWAVDPAQDDLGSLAARIRRFAADMLEARDIAWTFDVGEDGGVKLSPERRRHVLLVFQEAINNVVRHAHARRVAMRLGVNGMKLEAEIVDDGRGIDPSHNGDAQNGGGRGLSNMRSRARDLGGELTVTPGDSGGTRVQLFVPVL